MYIIIIKMKDQGRRGLGSFQKAGLKGIRILIIVVKWHSFLR